MRRHDADALATPTAQRKQVGETPVGYGYEDLTQDDLSYTISGLQPGVPYTVYVSALNRHGQGARATMESGGVTLPVLAPSAPTNVTVATKGYGTTEGDGIGDSQVSMTAKYGKANNIMECAKSQPSDLLESADALLYKTH